MAHINHLGDLKRELHHIKTIDGDEFNGRPKYEPCMVLLKNSLMGRSFMIPLSAMWKYIEPKDNRDARMMDRQDFDLLAAPVLFKKRMRLPAAQWADDAAAIMMAEDMNIKSGFLLCTAYNLVKCCQMLNITVSGPALSQLLMFIQDGLTGLRTMRLPQAESKQEIGELTINLNDKISHVPLALTETEQMGVL
jgi:hypothetical protein